MAKLYNGINGPVSGRIGDLIFSSNKGVAYVKRAPKPSFKKPSDKQEIQREKFGMAMRFLSPLGRILNESYRKINPKASGLNCATKQILAEAITGESPDLKIDFSKVSLIRGSLASPRLEMVYMEESNELLMSWPCAMSCNSYLNDELFALIYCPSPQPNWHEIKSGILRAEQGGVIKLPNHLAGREIHIWLAYRSEMMDSFSESVYMGQVFTQKLNDHENS